MKIQLAEHYGLCFGVRDAIAQAEKLASNGPLTILGELVHNPVVRERLDSLGVREGRLDSPGDAPTPQVMITAHGASDATRAAWRSAGFGVADGTCPLVKHAHHQLRLLVELGAQPVVIGKSGHVEVNGLIGDFPDAIVIENEGDFSKLPAASRYGVVSQTTQPIERVEEIVAALRVHFPTSEILFRDTVCQPTKNRQNALRKLLAECDTLVVVGGHNSNNTLQLVAAAEAAGRRAIHITRTEELRDEWLEGAQVVGVTAGTSTLKETVAAVVARLESIAAKSLKDSRNSSVSPDAMQFPIKPNTEAAA
jgi:4-hydroxy-3-methylbut-2-enyl diphosphate reductase